MKWSIYNELIFENRDDYVYLFNCLSKKFFTLNKKLTQLITDASKKSPDILYSIHPELYDSLVAEKFILPDDDDEKECCLQHIKHTFNSNETLRITINPTLDCNLKCWYCYENHIKGSSMNNQTINNVINFVANSVKSKTIKKVHLSFFGGEPLLKYENVVKPIIKACKNICLNSNKEIMISFTTNGVSLTSKVVDELMSISRNLSFQVAFDGNKELHDKIKYFASGHSCYELVKKQLKYAINKQVLTTIRCNYTYENLDSFVDLINDFKEFNDYTNLRFSFHKVWQEPESIELQAKRTEIKKIVAEIGVKSNINSFFGDSILPCYSDFDNSVVINYNGDI